MAIIKTAMPVIGIGCWTSRLVVAFGIGNITILSLHRATVANLIDICGSPHIDFPILLAGRKALLFAMTHLTVVTEAYWVALAAKEHHTSTICVFDNLSLPCQIQRVQLLHGSHCMLEYCDSRRTHAKA